MGINSEAARENTTIATHMTDAARMCSLRGEKKSTERPVASWRWPVNSLSVSSVPLGLAESQVRPALAVPRSSNACSTQGRGSLDGVPVGLASYSAKTNPVAMMSKTLAVVFISIR